jgi:Flp pilus assembly pilin Flp
MKHVHEQVDRGAARRRGEEGATATEYLVLVVFIALAIIAGATLFGETLNGVFDDAGAELESGVN